MNKLKKIFYFSATHWDREWYKTINEFRFKLVPVINKIIETLENDLTFSKFTLDGQTSILDDYLEIMPQNEKRLTQLIKDGRLLIGPWYTMPDEFLNSYESLVANLALGHKTARKYGAPAIKFGYVCDIFGHVANFPQILNSFDIHSALLSRGLNDEHIGAFFNWKSPNGDTATTFKAPELCGYGSYYYECIAPLLPNPQDKLDQLLKLSIDYVNREMQRTNVPYVILMDGMDHENIHPYAPKIAKMLKEHFDCPVVFEDLSSINEELANYSLPTHNGEINELGKKITMHNMLITHTLSSRVDLKQKNDECQTLLEKYANPITAIAATLKSAEIPPTYLEIAYKNLIENQAHDSICGCSIDAVHRDMHYRFNKCLYIANEVKNLYYEKQYRDVCVESQKNNYAIAVFNPLPYEYNGELTFNIDFSPEYENKENLNIKYEQRNTFILSDSNGQKLNYSIENAKRNTHIRNMNGNYNIVVDTHTVSAMASLKPLCFTYFYVTPTTLPFRNMERLSTSATSAENSMVILEINANGTINITDKKTNKTYVNMHSFVDKSEIGDGWFHIPAICEREISSIAAPATIEKIFDGYAKCVFRVTKFLLLPKDSQKINGFAHRSENYEQMTVVSEFTISRNSKLIKIKTRVDNNILDHFFTVNIPTYTNSKDYMVNQCNLLIKRDCGLNTTGADWREADIGEKQFESIVCRKDKLGGIMFVGNCGLHETYCPTDKNSSINITLFRAFSATVSTDGETDGQLQKRLEFNYAIMPTSDETDCDLIKIKDVFCNKPDCFTIPTLKKCSDNPFFTFISDNLAYNTMMIANDPNYTIVRLTNYSDKVSGGRLLFNQPVTFAKLVNSLQQEEPDQCITINNNIIDVTLAPYKTATIKLNL